MQVFYQMAAFEKISACHAFAGTARQALADSSPAIPVDLVCRICWWSLPFRGPRMSLSVKDFAADVIAECTNRPATSCSIIILPNTAKFRSPANQSSSPAALDKAVQEFKDEIILILRESPQLVVTQCSAQYNEETMYSNIRDLRLEFLLVMASSTSQAAGVAALASKFAKSALYKRRAVSKLLETFPRQSFANWSQEMAVATRGSKLEVEAEMRQWHTGQHVFTAILTQLFRGVNFGEHARVQLLDMTMYDDQLLATVVTMNTAADKNLPVLSYTGVSWGTMSMGQIKVTNLQEAGQEQLMAVARREVPLIYMQGIRLPAKPIISDSQRPQFRDGDFIVTCPIAAGQLAIRQSYYDKWSTSALKTTGGLSWADIVKSHDEKFNVGGVPYKSKRLADTSVDDIHQSSSPAVKLSTPAADQPQTLEDLQKARGVRALSNNPTLYSFYVTAEGSLWLYGEGEGVITQDDCLFSLRGTARVGPAATKSMKDSKSWVEYKMTGSDVVTLGFATPLKKEWPSGPRPLNEAMHFLEQLGFVRVQIHLHSAARDPGSPGSYNIVATDAGAWDIGTETTFPDQDKDKPLAANQLAGYINVPDLKKCEHVCVVPKLQFNPSTNKIMAGFPAVYFKQNIQIDKGFLTKLF